MAWNRYSTEDKQQKKPRAKAPSAMRGVIAGVVVVVLGALCFFIFSGKSEAPKAKEEKERGRIKEVTPAPAPKVKVEAPREKTPYELYLERADAKLKAARDKARAQGLPWADAPRKSSQLPPEKHVFEYNSERHIASLLKVEPGTPIIGEFDFGEEFMEDMKQAFAFKIKIDPEKDDEYTQELKKAVQETKDDLYKRFLEGEDIGAIFRDTRKQLQTLGIAKMHIDIEMQQMLDKPDLTAEDMEDFEKAAGVILKEKGMEEVKMPHYWSKRLQLLKSKKN